MRQLVPSANLDRRVFVIVLTAVFFLPTASEATANETLQEPIMRVVDLNVGETRTMTLADDSEATVTLRAVRARRDNFRGAVRDAEVDVEVNGQTVTLPSAGYHLPQRVAGVRIDCAIVRSYLQDHARRGNPWGLDADARLRLWPEEGPLVAPEFRYPVRLRWFASDTQMANVPVFVDRGECPVPFDRAVYYPSGLDFGGVEGDVEVLASTDGIVVSVGDERLDDIGPSSPRYDAINVRDARGWHYRYSHLISIDPSVRLGEPVRAGQLIGILGKEGHSGGWAHLHFGIATRQASGQWGQIEPYAFIWEAYQREHAPELIAVARPHHVAWAGETVTLDASRSWSADGAIERYEWTFTDGTTAQGPRVERAYPEAGAYSEILKVTDAAGRVAYDFAVVQVADREHPGRCFPTLHIAYSPTVEVRPGEPITFKGRAFGTTEGVETWDFGDGSATVETQSDGNVQRLNPDGYAITTHTFARPGDYIVTVQRTDEHGATATSRLWVPVREP